MNSRDGSRSSTSSWLVHLAEWEASEVAQWVEAFAAGLDDLL